MHGRICLLGFALLGGCGELPEPTAQDSAVPTFAQAFDSANTGTIQGCVVWDGDVPTLEPVMMKVNAYHNCLHKTPVRCVPPHQPIVNSQNHGIADVVVFLRGVDPRHAKPWDHAQVRVEFRDRQMYLMQGTIATGAAFVRQGHAIEAVNHDADYHALRGRGADHFGLPLIKRDQPSRRILPRTGIVELTSGAGYYWQHAHLFVADHPYYARTDADGRFRLDQVPAGTYELICWMPSWHVTRKEIDPETAVIARLTWAPPQEQRQTVHVQARSIEENEFRWTRSMFDLK
jgi:hypothetical protein